MKKLSTLLTLSTLAVLLFSCSQKKQFDSCDDMASDLKGKYYDDLVKKWGEPIKKDEYNMQYDVIWSGVGVNGKDVEIVFDLDYVGTEPYPSKYKGTLNCN